jgi:hypothetical protein
VSRNIPSFAVLVVCAERFGDYRDDVRAKLIGAGCTHVDVVLAHQRTPSFEQIRNFHRCSPAPAAGARAARVPGPPRARSDPRAAHSVLVWSNEAFHDAEALGDVLADAIDEGVGVVLCAYTMKLHDKVTQPPRARGPRFPGGAPLACACAPADAAGAQETSIGGRLESQYLPINMGSIAGGEVPPRAHVPHPALRCAAARREEDRRHGASRTGCRGSERGASRGQELTMRPYARGLDDRPEVAPILEGVAEFSGGRESMHLTIEKKVRRPTAAVRARRPSHGAGRARLGSRRR